MVSPDDEWPTLAEMWNEDPLREPTDEDADPFQTWDEFWNDNPYTINAFGENK